MTEHTDNANGRDGKPCGLASCKMDTAAETRIMKINKRRIERRRAKRNPECVATYGRYKGWFA